MFVGEKRGLRPIAQAAAAEDAVDVVLYRALVDHLSIGDLLVRGAGLDETPDL
jgi:hypothetical protein